MIRTLTLPPSWFAASPPRPALPRGKDLFGFLFVSSGGLVLVRSIPLGDSFPFACTCFAKDHTNWPRLYFTARHDLSACVFLCSFGFVCFSLGPHSARVKSRVSVPVLKPGGVCWPSSWVAVGCATGGSAGGSSRFPSFVPFRESS